MEITDSNGDMNDEEDSVNIASSKDSEQSRLMNDGTLETCDSTVGNHVLVTTDIASPSHDYLNNDENELVNDVPSPVKDVEEEGEETECDVGDESIVLDEDINPAPDGGYGWLVVLGSMLVHLIIGGFERSSGILYLKLIEKFQQSAVATAWVLSLSAGLRLSLGPLSSIMSNRFTHRSVVIGGSVIVFVSMIATALSPNLTFIYFSFGIVGGVGRLFTYAPAVIIVGEYFNKKRGLAVGLSTSGVGFGSFLFPTMIETFFTFYGYFGSFLLIGAVMLHLAVCGCLFRPLWLHIQMTEHRTRQRQLKDKELGTELLEQNPNAEEQKTPGNRLKVISRKSKNKSKKFLDLSLLKDFRFVCFCIAIMLFTLSFQIAFVFIPPYAKSKGMTDLQASYAVSIAGICDGIGRIVSGIVLDLKHVKPYRVYIYNTVMFFIGLTSFVVPNLDTFGILAAVCAVYGLFVGTYMSQKSVIIVDILGVKHLVSSFGLLICFQGIGMFLGPPIAGIMKDMSGHYDGGFYLGGSSMIAGGLILATANLHHYLRQLQKD
ncbi:monocarboxylate transporter 13-like [Argopecten irradians]|uniref:monocarboxylate transporter 13-like n=1 Tax=Argopecten irradians TaxID=31199 RepID=UPI00371CB311